MSFDADFDADFNGPAGVPVRLLIDALRSPLAEGFAWEFRRYACGLAERLEINLIEIVNALPPRVFMKLFDHRFGISEWDGVVPLYGMPAREVTPAMVADKLEALLAEREAG